MISYDPNVIRTFAQQLYDRASTIVMVNSLIGLLVAGVVGKLAFNNIGMLLLAAAGGGIGYFLGLQKAFILKLQAQTSLCQVQIEENTRSSHGAGQLSPIAQPPLSSSTPAVSAHAAPLGPLGTCPNCSASIPLASDECPKCKASFGSGSAWQVQRN